MAKILVVEDDGEMSSIVARHLESENHLVDVIEDGQEAHDHLCAFEYDLVILDWVLPGLAGPEICRRLRSAGSTTPVIFLTGQRKIDEKEIGLDAGADDYLTKPVELRELSARVRAAVRRGAMSEPGAKLQKSGSLELDERAHRIRRDGQDLRLQPMEFSLLEFLMRHPGTVFSAEALIQRVWPTDSQATADMVRKYVNTIRAKIDTKGKPSLIRTVHGIGYSFEP